MGAVTGSTGRSGAILRSRATSRRGRICALPATPTADERSDPRLGHNLHLARRIAEAQVDIIRIRRARHAMLARAFENPNYRSWRGNRARIEMLGQVVELRRVGIPLPDEMVQAFHFRHQGVEKYALILADFSRELFAFDRYERRALSRRKFAIRAFDEAQVAPVGARTAALAPAIDAASPVALDPTADRSPKHPRGKRRRLPAVSSPSPLVGEGRGGGSGGCDARVPDRTTPTPDPSPAEPRYSEGSAAHQSDRSRQQPTSVGGGEKRLPDPMEVAPHPLRPWDRAPGGEGTVAFWRSKAKEAKFQFKMNACAKARAGAASLAGKGGSLSPREAVRRIFKILWKDDLPEGAPEWLLAERACRPP